MSLFQRIRRPFGVEATNDLVPPSPAPPPIGTLLRERREELGLDLEAIGQALRIKPAFLAALEQGRAQDLPGPTYAIGFIRAYAQHLGFNAERVLARYKAQSADIDVRPDLALPVPLAERSLPGGPILLVAVILALCGYGTWYYLSTGERNRPERVAAVPADLQQAQPPPVLRPPELPPPGPSETPAAAPPPVSELPPPDGSAPPAVVAAAPTPGATPGPAGEAAKPSEDITIRALADCWIQVRSAADQSIVFSRVLKAGETYHVPRPGLLLRTGNAGALAIVVDGKPAPAIGRIGTLLRSVALDPAALLAGTAAHG
ncbi:MAG TPA: RodZ domain-containing protein [Stellaceae bacterium]|nr:RodZ domain-containing protein [Stellaceae bacterium]